MERLTTFTYLINKIIISLQNQTIGNRIFFRDEDSLSVNTHVTYEIHNDNRDILRPVCTAYSVDNTGVSNSAISCRKYI